MPTSIKTSGDKLAADAIVAPKVNKVNVMFILPAGFILPTFQEQSGDWYAIEGDENGATLADEKKVKYILHNARLGEMLCKCNMGDLGNNHDVDLKIDDTPPEEFAKSILVNKSYIQSGI